jgi:hypothetical protein
MIASQPSMSSSDSSVLRRNSTTRRCATSGRYWLVRGIERHGMPTLEGFGKEVRVIKCGVLSSNLPRARLSDHHVLCKVEILGCQYGSICELKPRGICACGTV